MGGSEAGLIIGKLQRDVKKRPQAMTDVLDKQMRALDWRDLQLWGLTALLLLVVGAGLVTLTAVPAILELGSTLAHQRNLPQLVVGLITLLVLLNIYTLHQRIRLQKTRHLLFEKLQTVQSISQTDPLTGTFNRRVMHEILEREVSRAERNDNHLCLMVVDVNDFKMFNTEFGHTVGDRVLVDVAKLLKKNFRAIDSVVRYGGDEFVVIMPDTTVEQAEIAEERLHRTMAKWNEANAAQGYKITLSSGIAQYDTLQTSEQLIHQADQAMYAKKSRRVTFVL